MATVHEVNSRSILCTIVAELNVPDNFDEIIATYNLYNLALQCENTYPFLMDMIEQHDLVLSCASKPAPTGQARYCVITARFSSVVSNRYDLPVDPWQKYFLNFLRQSQEHLWRPSRYESAAAPLITVYNQPAKSFYLTT